MEDQTENVEQRATKLVANWTEGLRKLRDLEPEIRWVQEEFRKLLGSETILGCRDFKSFCTTHLKRTEQAVYAMLGDYTAKATTRKGAAPAQSQTSSGASTLPTDSIESLREAAEVAGEAFAAMKQGDMATAEKMASEFDAIKDAHKPSSPMFDLQQREMLAEFISANLDLYSRIENGLTDGISIKDLQTHVAALRKRFALLLGKHESAPTWRKKAASSLSVVDSDTKEADEAAAS
jgi:hypothetical protein